MAVFAAGGVADLAWHEVFDVEASLDALLSPSHLVLFAGGQLILTGPLRARWATGSAACPAGAWVAVGSLILATALAAFFLLYVSAFIRDAPLQAFRQLPGEHSRHDAAELPAVAGLASYLVTTALLVVPVLLLVRRARPPRGAVTLLVVTVGGLSVLVVEFPCPAVAGVVGAVLGAAAVDLVLAGMSVPGKRLDAARRRRARSTMAGARSMASTRAAPNLSRISRTPYPEPQPISNARPPGTRPPSRANNGVS